MIATGRQAAAIGELRNHGMYPLDAILYLVPEKVRSVYAITGSYFFDNAKEAGVEDMAFITMEMDRGIIATTSLGRTPIAHTNGYGGDQTIRVMGTHGMLFLDANRPSWTAHGRSGASNVTYGPAQPDAMVEHFVSCIPGGQAADVQSQGRPQRPRDHAGRAAIVAREPCGEPAASSLGLGDIAQVVFETSTTVCTPGAGMYIP